MDDTCSIRKYQQFMFIVNTHIQANVVPSTLIMDYNNLSVGVFTSIPFCFSFLWRSHSRSLCLDLVFLPILTIQWRIAFCGAGPQYLWNSKVFLLRVKFNQQKIAHWRSEALKIEWVNYHLSYFSVCFGRSSFRDFIDFK